MMRNRTGSAYIILLSIVTILFLYIPKNEVTAKEEVIIPNEAIRLRILANSDSDSDQQLKRKVRDAVNQEITKWVKDLTSLEDAREVIQLHLSDIQKIAEKVVQEQNESQSVKAKFDLVQFPTKLYGQFLYPAGEYEAILITLGEGKGANWWCVLFPPLCFLDFSNGVAVSDGFEDEKQQQKVKQTSTNEEISINSELPDQTKEVRNEAEEPKQSPVYTEQDEDEVKVKFFVAEVWKKLF
jgi:stage II sporulation protein R